MSRYFSIFVMLILAGRVAPESTEDLAVFPLTYNEINTGESIMFKPILGYPNYEFNSKTLEAKSLKRQSWTGKGYRTVKEKILKPLKDAKGYYRFTLYNKDGRKHFHRHHISFLVHYGYLPEKPMQIDHIDADKTNDYWDNLQELTHSQNIAKGYQERGKETPIGVSWNKRNKKYVAYIYINGKTRHLGCFGTVEEASLAYQDMLIGGALSQTIYK